jgi:pimeloyl-ACP methyl ester carboxylesterase
MDGTGDLFGPLVRALPRGLEPTVVRFPAHERLGYADLPALIDRAIPRTGPYVVVAESFSGPLGILHAASRPPRLKALVLSATFASNPLPPSVRGIGVLARPALFKIRTTATFVRHFLAGRDVAPETLALAMSVAGRVDPEVMAFRLREVLAVDVEDALPRIEVPVLYLRASRDRLVGKRAMNRIAAGVADFRSVTFECHHLLLQTRPEEAVRELVQLLDGD